MSGEGRISDPKLHEVPPREKVGRDTIARFQSQFRAAANECLSLLEDGTLDRVYCDYQDDFVSRFNFDGQHIYNFYQVKTKKKLNHQWSVNEIFGMHKKASTKADPTKIADSFAGKLLIHTIKFKNSCGKVIFLTNIHFEDGVESLMNATQSSDDENNHYKLLFENFNDAFSSTNPVSSEEIGDLLKKLELQPGITYLAPDDDSFSALAREAIYKYSEIDLQYGECEEIINNLVSLVEKKSFNKLVADIDETELDELAGVGLHEMLDILSISKGAYDLLKSGGDSQAIKNASIIQRLLEQAGASETIIEYVSDWKVKWDIWFKDKRHTMAEFDLIFLQDHIEIIASDWALNKHPFDKLKEKIDTLAKEVITEGISMTLSRELLLGAVFSAVVRNEAQ